MSQHRVTIILAVFLSVILTVLYGCSDSSAKNDTLTPTFRSQALVAREGYTLKHQIWGTIESAQRVKLGFEISGKITHINVNDGEKVSKGQRLALLDSQVIDSNIRMIEARLEDIRSRRGLIELKIEREQKLTKKGFATKQRVDNLNAKIASLNAQLKRQNALLLSSRLRSDMHTLVAPFSGVISARYIDEGSVTAAGNNVVQLLSDEIYEARVGVPARLLSTLQTGSYVSVIAKGQTNTGQIMSIAGSVDTLTHTATVRLSLPSGPNWIDGSRIYLILMEDIIERGFWVPNESIFPDVRGMQHIYVEVAREDEGAATTINSVFTQNIESRNIDILFRTQEMSYIKGAIITGDILVIPHASLMARHLSSTSGLDND